MNAPTNPQTFIVAPTRGQALHAVSSQWFSRPADQRFLNLDDLYQHTRRISDESRAHVADVRDIRISASRDDADTLNVHLDGVDAPIAPTHWSFGQLASLVQAPAGYLRRLPAPIAAINLQYATHNFRSEMIKAYVRQNGATELRAATGPEYGRIFDHEVVGAVRRIAGNGTGDTNWKVPGMSRWEQSGAGYIYDPHAPITPESTTLFASDRDVFLFLVDDTHPIEVGKLADGSPDICFRGFYTWNSETGSKTFGLASFLYRMVCCNRIIWGAEQFQEIKLRHSKGAPSRFLAEAAPALLTYSNAATDSLVKGVQDAKRAILARTDDDRTEFLAKRGFSKPETKNIIEAVIREEGKAPESAWDFVQGITAVARTRTHQDERVELEQRAGKIMSAATR